MTSKNGAVLSPNFRRHMPRLLRGSSIAVVALVVSSMPVQAQLAARRATTLTAPVITPVGAPSALRSVRMSTALGQQAATISRADSIRTLVSQARAAAVVSVARVAANGLASSRYDNGNILADRDGGLVPIAGVRSAAALRARAAALSAAGDAAGAATLGQQANAIVAGMSATNDATGRATWQGADLPTETVTDGQYLVSINQTSERAILSWNRFDVGSNTTVQFNQKQNGVAQLGWVALNRVVDSTAPSTILGRIKADGTVLVLNPNGVIFGAGAQVNLHSLLASSLEIGNFGKATTDTKFTGLSVRERNLGFLQNGLLGGGSVLGTLTFAPMLTSALVDDGSYDVSSVESIEAALGKGAAGAVEVDRGATIKADTGGFVILTAPKIVNDGALSASEGQVSLQAGRGISYTQSTGAATGADPNVRGLILRSPYGTDGTVLNSGLIDSPRGYLSLGAGFDGSVTNSGLLSSTTSVSRNGKISLSAGSVMIGGAATTDAAGGIVITPDSSAEVIPQGSADSPANFKTSQIEIGSFDIAPASENYAGRFGPAAVTLGQNALIYAPNATVDMGGRANSDFDPLAYTRINSGSIAIGAGALVDVSGVKDYQVDASRNSVLISPLKRNELRDTPTYREATTDGNFTLNGASVYIDPRLSGTRADGVRWVGSPLIDGSGAVSQIGITAAEFMTKGGNVTMAVAPVGAEGADGASAPRITIDSAAKIDFSGGWVRYLAGTVRSSKLLTAGGKVVDISEADPNETYVAVGDGFTEVQTKFGISRSYANALLQGAHFEQSYTEGRDAGSLVISASTASIDGTLDGAAHPGERQIADAVRGSATTSIAGDARKLQASATQLPSGGYLRIGSFSGKKAVGLGADIVIHADGATPALSAGAFSLSDALINAADLSALTLQTTGSVEFQDGSQLALANGGALTVDAGRTIRFDGDVIAHSGGINVRTYAFAGANSGSPFRSDDNVAASYARGLDLPSPFDILVNGTVDATGLWANDVGSSALEANGAAFGDGGSISLTVAPKVLASLVEADGSVRYAADLSGSIRIASDALLNVSSGGFVKADGTLNLTAKGGSVALINETTYASLSKTGVIPDGSPSEAGTVIHGDNQSVTFTPIVGVRDGYNSDGVVPSLVPETARAEVSFDTASIKGWSFGGGGIFTLVAPDISFGSNASNLSGSNIGLDFLARTGFGALDLSAWNARFVGGLFNNGNTGNSAFFNTSRFVVGAGETLDLTQVLMPSILDAGTVRDLLNVTTGADITSVLTPVVPVAAWDRRAAKLKLGGLTELDVMAGGTITGAAEAAIIAPAIYNAGTIRIAGGTISQRAELPDALVQRAVGVKSEDVGGQGLAEILGGETADGRFDEAATIVHSVKNSAGADTLLTNGDLFTRVNADQTVYFTGLVGQGDGIALAGGSTTDLAGTAIFNPRAPYRRGGAQLRQGRMIGGGTITTAAAYADPLDPIFSDPTYGNASYLLPGNISGPYLAQVAARRLAALPGAIIDISGAAAVFDELGVGLVYRPADQWSDAGRISALGGGSLAGATIRAQGGTAKAMGGTLEWLSPNFVQNGAAVRNDDMLYADQIEGAGFDTFIARRSLSVAGNVDLQLGNAFILQSAPANAPGVNEAALSVFASVAKDASASFSAPYIHLSSLAPHASDALVRNGAVKGAGSLSFNAANIDLVGGLGFIVPTGGNGEGRNVGSVSFNATGDIRITGVSPLRTSTNEAIQPGLSGQLISTGDINFTAARVYATTGTGGYQQRIEDMAAGKAPTNTPFTIASSNADGAVTFARNGTGTSDAPLSAGTHLRILGAHVNQNGVLQAPFGMLEFGSDSSQVQALAGLNITVPRTLSLEFGANSLTSVSGEGLNVPYGTTTDLTEYFFTPATTSAITVAPSGALSFTGSDILMAEGATANGRGGGDLFSFEFIPGTGGSRDVLDRFNPDAASGNEGLQFADGRQVFAILPKDQANQLALFDPIFSADYAGGGGVDLYGVDAGKTVILDGLEGGEPTEYLLLPAHYALLPGAMRVVENVGAAAPVPGMGTTLLDGSVVVGGVYGTKGTGFVQSTRRSFTVQDKESWSSYSRIDTTSANETVTTQAAKANIASIQTSLDAARVILSPLKSLELAGSFITGAATGGRGEQVDILGKGIEIVSDDTAQGGGPALVGTVQISTSSINSLNAESLSFGAARTNGPAGTTSLAVTAKTLFIDGDVTLSAPELLFAVGGEGSALTIEKGARISATGTLGDTATGDYIIPSSLTPGASFAGDPSGIGSVVRLSSGAERLVRRTGDAAIANADGASTLTIGAANFSANSLLFDTNDAFTLASGVTLGVENLALSGNAVKFDRRHIAKDVQEAIGAINHVTLRSNDVIGFTPDEYSFHNLKIDAPAIGYVNVPRNFRLDLIINADNVEIGNSGEAISACHGSFAYSCGDFFSTFTLNAKEVAFNSGSVQAMGWDGGTTINAANGIYVQGAGSFVVDNLNDPRYATLTLNTPFIVDRALVADPTKLSARPDYAFETLGDIFITGPSQGTITPTGDTAPGARLRFGGTVVPAQSVTITDALIRATAGTIDIRSDLNVRVSGTTALEVPGYVKSFGDATDRYTVSANGGLVSIKSVNGGIFADDTSSIVTDSGVGKAGALTLLASRGAIDVRSTLNGDLAAGAVRTGSFQFDSGASGFDLSAFVSRYGSQFGGDISIYTRFDPDPEAEPTSANADLLLAAGQKLRARSLSLTAENGKVLVDGIIDVSGDDVSGLAMTDAAYGAAIVNGGKVSLFGGKGVALGATARIDTSTSGYAAADTRSASAGDVVIGIGIAPDASLSIASGAVLDMGAARTGDRFVADNAKDAVTGIQYAVQRFVEGDTGGNLTLRAPVSNANLVSIANDGNVIGAASRTIEGYRRFDLDRIGASGAFIGITADTDANQVYLNAAATGAKPNFLADDAAGTIPNFIRNFSVAAANGQSLDGYRVRPGVELRTDANLNFVSNWNLGAGAITDYEGAVAAGLMRVLPLGAYTSGPLKGQPRYEVIPGKEAELFQRFVTMTYRVGGSVSGEAPIVSVRARGNVDISNSITDGFFAFHDRTDPDYMSYQLGGGDRTYNLAVNATCGVNTSACEDVVAYSDTLRNNGRANYIQVRLTTPEAGDDIIRFVHSPYSALANSAGALGAGAGGAGDPLGIAELFPLLADGSAVHSSDYRFAGGAGDDSVNPLHIDYSGIGSVIVEGEKSYTVAATAGKAFLGGDALQLAFRPAAGEATTLFDPAALIDSAFDDPEKAANFATLLDLRQDGSALAAKVRDAAVSYFKGGNFVRSGGQVTAVIVPLARALEFMTSQFGADYARDAAAAYAKSGLSGVKQSMISFTQKSARVGTVVRTGDGSISLAAARDISLENRTLGVVDRDANGRNHNAGKNGDYAQVGGTAVYTAGQRLTDNQISSASVYQAESLSYIPTPRGALSTAPVLAGNGGAISILAGRDVLGRRDIWAERYLGDLSFGISSNFADLLPKGFDDLLDKARMGGSEQRWRVGTVGLDTEIAIAPQYFTAGIGALAGGDVTISALGKVNDLTIALDNSVTTGALDGTLTLYSYGSGNLALRSAGDLLGGGIDVASGVANVIANGSIGAAGDIITGGPTIPERFSYLSDTRNLLRVRVSNATAALSATGAIDIGGIGALGATDARAFGNSKARDNANGFFTALAGVSFLSMDDVTIVRNRPELLSNFNAVLPDGALRATYGNVLAPSLSLASLNGTAGFGTLDTLGYEFSSLVMLYPSAMGQLTWLSAGSIGDFALAMSDADPTDLPGAFTAADLSYSENIAQVFTGLGYSFPAILPNSSDTRRRLLHDADFVQARDSNPVRILTDGSISNAVLSLPKVARIGAGEDIENLYFDGQNVSAADVTRIVAGRDITGTTLPAPETNAVIAGRPYISGNNFVLGGPGAFSVEAGRDLGPFLTSAEVNVGGPILSYAGGIRTVGNENNPWLPSQGASIYTMFGIANGTNFDGLRDTYLDPVNLAQLDGDLFEQKADAFGNLTPDRSRPAYAPVLLDWMQSNVADALSAAVDTVPGDATARKEFAYARYADVYAAFKALDPLTQRAFLLDKLYFGELSAPADPNGPSYQQSIRGYRAVQTLFPAKLGYTDNLAAFTVDPATINADHPLGVPTRKLVDGKPLVADRKVTGKVDLRLSTIQTARGGDITILGPGGDFIAGSLVRTEAQIARRATGFGRNLELGRFSGAGAMPIQNIPLGNEGVLTLRGGAVHSFTDGDFQLNQSRLFTLRGGDITMWSSNGDLNAGQGPKNSSNFPPVRIRFDLNGYAELDSAGSVSGAGIGTFKPTPDTPAASVTLLAPVGTIDAGDAGLRISGAANFLANVFANADNVKAGGTVSGLPSATAAPAPAAPASAASAIAANMFRAGGGASDSADRMSRIIVDILGYFGDGSSGCANGTDANGACL